MPLDKIEKVKKIKGAIKPDHIQEIAEKMEQQNRVPPNKEQFDKLMTTEKLDKMAPTKVEPTSKPSLMDEVRKLNQSVDRYSKGSPRDLITQADYVISQMDEVKKKLANPSLDLKPSTQTLLNNKLSHIDENLKIALSRAGLEYTPVHTEQPKANPIDRFLGFLTNGQEQLKSLTKEVEYMHLNNKEISPANMLRIQIKMGYITQEVEFFSNVLNQALQSTKTIMNVQV